jgi:tetratricopeptide (TPR) repeat protein
MRALALTLIAASAWAGPQKEIWHAIDEERLEEAREKLAAWKADSSQAQLEHQFIDGYLAYLHGEYARGAGLIDAVKDALTSEDLKELHRLVKKTDEVLRNYEETRSPKGHFIVRHAPGKDAILVPYALDALEAAYEALGGDFGDHPSVPVRVEIVPDPETLAQVSSLTLKEIETSGTIALCKYNRLTIVSPRALAYGYPWLDTLTHEYTHYIVSRVSHNHVPIWLHEGLAKFEEQRWDKPEAGGALSPTMQHLLSGALHGSDKLISFERMHPSIAKLPSQEQAALAFAEVYTAVEYLHQKIGWAGIRKIVESTRETLSAEKSIAKVLGVPFARFESEWKAWLRGRSFLHRPGQLVTALKFKKTNDKGDPKNDDEDGLSNKDAKRHARLGGMLRARNHLRAAAVEYEKAQSFVGPGHPRLAGKLGRIYLELGDLDKAIDAVRPALERYPETAGPYATLGEAYFKKGQLNEAERPLRQAIASSPFNPELHCMLKEIYERSHDEKVGVEQRACDTLSR